MKGCASSKAALNLPLLREMLKLPLASFFVCNAAMIEGNMDDRVPLRNTIPLSTESGCPSIFLNTTPRHLKRS
jgi:hypothetical protein